MVRIKKKVTLKTKVGQSPVDEPVRRHEAQPILRKKEPPTEVGPVPPAGGNGGDGGNGGGKKKAVRGIAAIAVVCLLCYGAYSFLSPSDDNDGATAGQVGGDADITSDGGGTKDAHGGNSPEVSGTEVAQGGEVADGGENNSPAGEGTAPEAPTAPSGPKQAASVEPEEPAAESGKPAGQAETSDFPAPSGTLEQIAKEVIRGDYGNGLERKRKLGSRYDEIQGKVNEMYRNGLVR